MDQLTHTVRRSNWINIIRQCQDRPAGTTAKQWLAENDISEISFDNSSVRRPDLITAAGVIAAGTVGTGVVSRAVFTGISTKERADGVVTSWSPSCSQTSRRIFRSQ